MVNNTRRLVIGVGCMLFFIGLVSCQDELLERVPVYSLDLNSPSSQIINQKQFDFYGDTVLGWYHAEEIVLNLNNLPAHNTIEVTVELLIHDSWDGNQHEVGGPDLWYMQLDGETIVNVTFSNSPCGTNYCMYQSYPENYPRHLEPKSGSVDPDLPGRCQYKDIPGWTTKYLITRRVKHKSSSLTLLLGDRLLQSNTSDPACDESWSISKLEVNALTVK